MRFETSYINCRTRENTVMEKFVRVVHVAVVGLAILGGCRQEEPPQQVTATVEEDGQKVTVTSTVPANPTPPQSMVPQSGRFTRDHAARIKDGMTIAEVEAIMGEPGQVQSNMTMGETEIVNYRWSNGGQSYIDVTFSGGRSAGKMSANLP